MKLFSRPALAAAFTGIAAIGAQASCVTHLSDDAQLWVEPQDTRAALLEPDCYAWQLFVALSWPGDPATQAADPTRALGDDGPATWELWRNVRPGSRNAVFQKNGKDPGPWLTGQPLLASRAESDFDPLPLQLAALLSAGAMPQFDLDAHNEVRMNKPTYEFVRTSELFNIEGQKVAFAAGTQVLDFPDNAKEIKARWLPISEADKPRYHWVEVEEGNGGGTSTYGLTALHIITKDLPNWFWATFEHIDNEKSENDGGLSGNPGWLDPSVDRYSCPGDPVGCRVSPPLVAGTKWENYVLRGTQIDFVDSRGQETILANSVIEAGFQASSSCITCHAKAAFDQNARFAPIFKSSVPPVGDVGNPDPAWFFENGNGTLIRTQADFIWSLDRACSRATEETCH